jgi:hypothetical protein
MFLDRWVINSVNNRFNYNYFISLESFIVVGFDFPVIAVFWARLK